MLASMLSDAVLNQDFPCIFCGYNLRSLHPSGRCPECGGEIVLTVHKINADTAEIRIGGCNPAIVGQWIEGLICIFCSLGMFTLLLWVMLPEVMVVRTPGRETALWISCAAWVINSLGIWKIARADPHGDRPNTLMRRADLRYCIAAYTALPALIFAGDFWPPIGGAGALLSIPSAIAGFAAASMLHKRLAHLAGICGRRTLARTMAAYRFITPIAMIWIMVLTIEGVGRDSLSHLLFLPVPSFISGMVPGVMPLQIREGDFAIVPLTIALAFIAADLTAMALLLRQLVKIQSERL